METYRVTNPDTGKTIKLTGESPPTEKELEDIFNQMEIGGTYQPKASPVPGGEAPISAITGKTQTEYVPGTQPAAGLGTLMKAGFVDDPRTQIQIYAEARGIDPSRYRIHNGEIIFRDEQGNWQRETGEMPASLLKRGVAQTLTNPAVIGGTVGAVLGGGVSGAMLGAAGGEGIRKSIGALAFGEEQSVTENLISMGTEAVLAGLGEGIGKGISKIVSKSKIGKKPAQYAGKEITEGLLTAEDHARAEVIRAIARKNNMELAPHQLYDKEGMTNIWMYLRKHPSTSDAIRTFEDNLARQTDDAIGGFIRQMGGYDETPFYIGRKLQEAASKSIESAKEVRRVASSPLYQKAFREAPDVDIKPVVKYIDTELATAKGEIRNQLIRAKKILEKPDLPQKTPAQKPLLVGPSGQPIGGKKAEFSWDTSLEGLHGSKIELDRIIDNARQDSLGNTVKRHYQNIKNLLLNQMDQSSPGYAAARQRYAELSQPVEALKKSVIGELDKMTKESVIAKSPHKLLDLSSMPDAKLLKVARQSIEPQDPRLWKQMVGGYIRDTYEGLKVTQGEGRIYNPAGKLYQKLFGSSKQREIMRAALNNEEYTALSDLMTVFQRASVGTGRQSMTAPFQQIEQQIVSPMQGRLYQFARSPKNTAVDWVFGRWNDILMSGRQGALLDVITSPDAIEQIKRLKPLSPGSKQLIEGLATYTALIAPKIGLEDIGSTLPGER